MTEFGPSPGQERFKSTLVVVPRETFSQSCDSLRNVLSSIADDQPVVVVDGHSPRSISNELQEIARGRPVTLVRTNRYLSPNEARNLGAGYAHTEYLVFVDNDLFVEPGWLEQLERCADETGASAVGPVYCIGRPIGDVVHMAGGANRLVPDANGRRRHIENHDHAGRKRTDLGQDFHRQQTELLEFHCLLVRTSEFDKLGPFDPDLLALHEHCDFCLLIQKAGGTVWLEPSAVVTYVPPRRLARTDHAFWFRRWSHSWSCESLDHFGTKWDVDPGDPARTQVIQYSRFHRRLGVPYFRPLSKARSFRARLARIAYRSWARLFESLALLMTLRMMDRALRVEVLTEGSNRG